MMKNYFEDMENRAIVPFKSVSYLNTNEKKELYVYIGVHTCIRCSYEQLDDYKQWLERQETHTSSETPNNWKPKYFDSGVKIISPMVTSKQSDNSRIPSTKWLIECWEMTQQMKLEELKEDDIEDFLCDCLSILDYAGALNNKNRGNILIVGASSN